MAVTMRKGYQGHFAQGRLTDELILNCPVIGFKRLVSRRRAPWQAPVQEGHCLSRAAFPGISFEIKSCTG